MQTIQIEVKDNYVENVMTILDSMKDIMVENITLKYNSLESNNENKYFNEISFESLKKDWDNDEDAVYDKFLQ